jgi:hypothetical protein
MKKKLEIEQRKKNIWKILILNTDSNVPSSNNTKRK